MNVHIDGAGGRDSSHNEDCDYRGGPLRPCRKDVVVGSWNVEGLTESKIEELQEHMRAFSIDILAIQETHKPESTYVVTDSGYLLVLSGDADDQETAGVGFLISPKIRTSIIGFRMVSSRALVLKLRVNGGKVPVFSIYAPHNGKPHEVRREFYQSLGTLVRDISAHGGPILLGDFNARLHRQFPCDSPHVGPYVFGCPTAQHDPDSNRSLLLELCGAHGLVVSNTFFEHPPEAQVTCYNIGSKPSDPPRPGHFGQIDFLLCPGERQSSVSDVRSRKGSALA